MDKKANSSFEVSDAEMDPLLKLEAFVGLPNEDHTIITREEYNKIKTRSDEFKKKVKQFTALRTRLSEENKDLLTILNACQQANTNTEMLDLSIKVKATRNFGEIINGALKLMDSYFENMITFSDNENAGGANDSDNSKMEVEGNACGIMKFDSDTSDELPSTSEKCNLKKITEGNLEDASNETKSNTHYIEKDIRWHGGSLVSEYPNTSGTSVIPKITVTEYSDVKTEPDHQVILKDQNYLDVPREEKRENDAKYPNIYSDNN